MKGKLLNVVSFVANNISVEGINLVSNFRAGHRLVVPLPDPQP